MSLAMDRTSKRAAWPLRIGILLAVCVAVLGCAGIHPEHRDGPRFDDGMARIRRIRMRGPVLTSDRPRDEVPAPAAPEPQTVVRSTAPPPDAVLPPRMGPERPGAVALELPPAEAPRPAAAATPEPAAVARVVAPKDDPKPPPAAADGLAEIATLVAAARAKLDAIASYQVRLTRQERVGEVLQPAEDVLLSVRRRPTKAVRLEWPDGPNKGREVLYAATEHGGLMHVKLADSLVPVPPLTLAPDSPLALRNSRHPISEAGLDTILERLENSLELSRKGDPAAGLVTDGGPETPEPLGRPCRKVVQKRPDGESWVVYLDAETHLPALVQANAAGGALLEKYLFRDLKTDVPELASAAAFDPTQRWGRAAGFLNRLARAAVTAAEAPKTPAATPSP